MYLQILIVSGSARILSDFNGGCRGKLKFNYFKSIEPSPRQIGLHENKNFKLTLTSEFRGGPPSLEPPYAVLIVHLYNILYMYTYYRPKLNE